MAWLPDGEKISKISLVVSAQLTNVTDGQMGGHRVTANTTLMQHRAVKSRPSRSPLTRVESSRERGQKSSRSIESIGKYPGSIV